MSRLIHYSEKPFTLDRARTYGQRWDPSKPLGLWVSVEGPDDWEAWCRAEEFRIEALAHRTTIVLDESARVLRIGNSLDLDLFTSLYGKRDGLYSGIHWAGVVGEYDAIIIAPYLWECRLADDFRWYYGWDCASGCIWNLGAIAECREIAALQVAATTAGESDGTALSPTPRPAAIQEPRA